MYKLFSIGLFILFYIKIRFSNIEVYTTEINYLRNEVVPGAEVLLLNATSSFSSLIYYSC